MENRTIKISSASGRIALKVIPGHFATNHAHTNYYVDMTTLKTRQSEASAIAAELATQYISSYVVDTILCLDGTEVVGAYLAENLCSRGVQIMNLHNTIYVVTPEYSAGQMIVRDNILPMIRGKHVLLLSATISSGISCMKSVESVEYYGGRVSAIASIFSSLTECNGLPVHSIFTPDELPAYQSWAPHVCPCCKDKMPLDALVNAHGYSKL